MSETKKLFESIQNKLTEGVDWNYYDKFEALVDKYMPNQGEGENKASQTVTAINKLIYKWYNDGDVYDNTYYMEGWANDISSYANWLYNNVDASVLANIGHCKADAGYELILKELADEYLNETVLAELEKEPKTGSIYDCDGPFKFEEHDDGEEDYYGYDPEEDYYDYEEFDD